ncbi:biotin-dependent carboxyltransferase family protein [Parasphingorhabdus halotolerans]|uniref:Biotin-dependent carboxyltransferase family protein n=2 Tax=Parasphingorhabdus halotolerans TaxID=2725558 RepID=A0A6H2DI73_9SPHN|nr:biotin-dependent carboxyltransferase family protein [Parasphingorhabdus halotolerans]
MPAAGAADCLSLALANRLVGKPADALAIEITLDMMRFQVEQPCNAALTGAAYSIRINGNTADLQRLLALNADDIVEIDPARTGCRSYLSIDKTLDIRKVLGGQSTYLQAGIGGLYGRPLKAGDRLTWTDSDPPGKNLKQLSAPKTPQPIVALNSNSFILRATVGPEFHFLRANAKQKLFEEKCNAGQRSSRMGIELIGEPLECDKANNLPSTPVFPGTIQCPPNGQPFLLGPDAQTTGGYPRIAQVIRADRHLIGQLRPGAQIQLVKTTPERATEIYREKLALLDRWLGPMDLW